MDISTEKTNVESMLMSFQLSPVVKRLNKYFQEQSFMEILHVERKENYHSNFLKWLFEDKDLYADSIRLLLMLLLKRSRQQNSSHFPKVIRDSLLTNSFIISNVSTALEDSIITNDGKGRCDLRLDISYLTGTGPKDLHVLIENKVFSDEHEVGGTKKKQTVFYYNHYINKYREENCVFVYLNLISSIELDVITEATCACKSFIQINYQDLLENVLEDLASNPEIPPRKQFIIKEYIRGLSIKKDNTIMAMDNELCNLLVDFWDNHNELIKLSLKALSESTTIDEDTRGQIIEANKFVQKVPGKRDTTHYKFSNKDCNGKSVLVYTLLEFFLTKKENTAAINQEWKDFLNTCKGSLDDFNSSDSWTISRHIDDSNVETIKDSLQSEVAKLKSNSLIYTEIEYQNQKQGIQKETSKNTLDHNYPIKTLNNTQYHCYNQWGWGNIDYMIKFYRDKFKDNGPEIELIYQ